MQDRVPLYPGRVKLVPVAGQENTYDMTRADQPTQVGDPLNKATLWSDATAALFGLGVGSVPDDGFAWLGKYNQNWWRRREYKPTEILFGEAEDIKVGWSSSPHSSWPVLYSEDITISGSSVSLKDPKTLYVSYLEYTEANKLKGKYFLEYDSTTVCYVEPTASDATRSGGYYVYINGKKIQSVSQGHPTGEWEYVQSSSRSAYPDSGEQDGYEYEYLGIPFDNAVGALKIETGSYIGTGTFGKDGPNSITLGFSPSIVLLSRLEAGDDMIGVLFFDKRFITFGGFSFVPVAGNLTTVGLVGKILPDKNSISWYSNSPSNQFNVSGITYMYRAIC